MMPIFSHKLVRGACTLPIRMLKKERDRNRPYARNRGMDLHVRVGGLYVRRESLLLLEGGTGRGLSVGSVGSVGS